MYAVFFSSYCIKSSTHGTSCGFFGFGFAARLPRLEQFIWRNFIPANRAPSFAQVRSLLTGLTHFPCFILAVKRCSPAHINSHYWYYTTRATCHATNFIVFPSCSKMWGKVRLLQIFDFNKRVAARHIALLYQQHVTRYRTRYTTSMSGNLEICFSKPKKGISMVSGFYTNTRRFDFA